MFFTIPSSFAGLPELPDQFVVDFHQGSLRTLRTRCDKSHPLAPSEGEEENPPKQIYYIEMLRLILCRNESCESVRFVSLLLGELPQSSYFLSQDIFLTPWNILIVLISSQFHPAHLTQTCISTPHTSFAHFLYFFAPPMSPWILIWLDVFSIANFTSYWNTLQGYGFWSVKILSSASRPCMAFQYSFR